MIKGIIFDLDGTLISERDYVLGCLKEVGSYVEKKYKTKNAYNDLKKILDIKWEHLFNRYFEEKNIFYDDSDIHKLIEIYRDSSPVVNVYPDVIDTLQKLRQMNVKIALLTNGYYSIQKKKILISGIEHLFDLIIIPDEKGRQYWKPNAWGYETALEYFKIFPSEMLMVGDMEHDFTAPKMLGMRSVYIMREDRMKEINNNEMVKTICSLNDLLEMKNYNE